MANFADFERLLAFNETFLYESVYESQFNGIISIKFRLELLSLTTVIYPSIDCTSLFGSFSECDIQGYFWRER